MGEAWQDEKEGMGTKHLQNMETYRVSCNL